MKYRFLFFALMTGAVVLAGCSLIGGAKPAVVISSPPSGSTYHEGDDVAVQSTSADQAGIVRVELTVDGAVVRNDTAPAPQANYSLIQTWKATPGSHTLIVRAYNAAGVASDPAAVSVQVNPAVAQNLATPTAALAPVIPSITPAPLPPGSPSPTTAAAPGVCTNNAAFVADVSIPDGTVEAAGATFNKTWRLSNTGTCAWGVGYQFVFISGEAMTASAVVAAPVTAFGTTADLLVPMTASTVPGNHSGTWRMRSAGGAIFGQSVSVKITVPGAPPPVPPPSGCSGAAVIASFTAASPTITAGGSTTLNWGAVTNADSVEIDHGIGGVPAPGSTSVSPGLTTTYTMTVHCGSNTATAQVTVTVVP
ncbi:MAG TPA: NBR1-Ig-like domain-containing protein, partial [Anaerolineae bacterium]